MSRNVSIIMNGVTGALGASAHLVDSILAIRQDGGIEIGNGDRIIPVPILVGRDGRKLQRLASLHGGLTWTTDLASCLADPKNEIYFDTSVTAGRAERAKQAIAAKKHVYLEKPTAESVESAVEIAALALKAGVKAGTVQDKVFLPGVMKMKSLMDSGALGKVHSVRLNFGWWIFDGISAPMQRPSWNYTRRGGGGITHDMSPHWRYIIEHLFGEIRSVSCRSKTSVPYRADEQGNRFEVDVEDETFATFELESGILVQVSSSWCTRVKREDLLIIQADGSAGSAVCGLHRCSFQSAANTPDPKWDVEAPGPESFDKDWVAVSDVAPFKNSYRAGWEAFLRHVVMDTPFPSPLIKGAKGVQLAEACIESDRQRRWVDLQILSLEV